MLFSIRSFVRNPAAYEYTPGYVFVDAGDAVYIDVLKILQQNNPWQMESVEKLCPKKKCDLLEGVLGKWRDEGRFQALRELEHLICEVNRRQYAIPAQSRIGPPPEDGYDFRDHDKFEQPPRFADSEYIDNMIMGRAGWDILGATYFEPGAGQVTYASYEPWAYEQIDMLNLKPGVTRDLGPYYSAEQIAMIYKVCLELDLGTNAKELHDLSYRGDRDVASRRNLRVWMTGAAKDTKSETESMDSDGVAAEVSVPSKGADAEK